MTTADIPWVVTLDVMRRPAFVIDDADDGGEAAQSAIKAFERERRGEAPGYLVNDPFGSYADISRVDYGDLSLTLDYRYDVDGGRTRRMVRVWLNGAKLIASGYDVYDTIREALSTLDSQGTAQFLKAGE